MKFELCPLTHTEIKDRLGIRMIAETKEDREKLQKLEGNGLVYGSAHSSGSMQSVVMLLHGSQGYTLERCGFVP